MNGLLDRWFRIRNQILSSPRFQRWAARFPLTRLIARRRAAALFDLCAGFVYSQVLQACVRLGLLEALASGPLSLEELAASISLSPDAAQRLLDAAVSLRLVERRRQGRYGLGVHGASFMGNPAVAAMVAHHALLYRDLADPVALLRGEHDTELRRFWSYAKPRDTSTSNPRGTGGGAPPSNDRGPGGGAPLPSSRRREMEENVSPYSELMASSLSLIAEDVLEAYPHADHRCLLDVGGGEGAFLEAAAARAPNLSLMLFDLPPVAARARERLARAGLGDRATVTGGDVLVDPLPEGADLVSLVRVVHDHDDPDALRILQAARKALRPGGTLLLAEPMARTKGAEPMGDAYFGFYLLAMGQGKPRTSAQLGALLEAAGFTRVRSRRTRRPMLTRLLLAEVAP